MIAHSDQRFVFSDRWIDQEPLLQNCLNKTGGIHFLKISSHIFKHKMTAHKISTQASNDIIWRSSNYKQVLPLHFETSIRKVTFYLCSDPMFSYEETNNKFQ